MPSAGCGAKGHNCRASPWAGRAAKGLVRLFRLSARSWMVRGLRCEERFPLFLCCWSVWRTCALRVAIRSCPSFVPGPGGAGA